MPGYSGHPMRYDRPVQLQQERAERIFMSQQNNFATGFVLGAIVGGTIGGILGAVLAAKINHSESSETVKLPDRKADKTKKSHLMPSTPQEIEAARRALEVKIAQLNDAIDDVRLQLSTVHSNDLEPYEHPADNLSSPAGVPESSRDL
ncbi:hypothetical protein [Trichothermofontia sp.]